ncbi:hypothetical protein KIH31_09685 [Paenarthrobacter sp. DKR-5]|nr:hypothetical protein [Paenarthrobacter sp. DKR-5]
MHIKEQWSRLDAATQQWLMDNPGSQVLPRTVTATINKETGENADVDLHGGTLLTEEDREFIQAKARAAKSAREASRTWSSAHRFFDAVGH